MFSSCCCCTVHLFYTWFSKDRYLRYCFFIMLWFCDRQKFCVNCTITVLYSTVYRNFSLGSNFFCNYRPYYVKAALLRPFLSVYLVSVFFERIFNTFDPRLSLGLQIDLFHLLPYAFHTPLPKSFHRPSFVHRLWIPFLLVTWPHHFNFYFHMISSTVVFSPSILLISSLVFLFRSLLSVHF